MLVCVDGLHAVQMNLASVLRYVAGEWCIDDSQHHLVEVLEKVQMRDSLVTDHEIVDARFASVGGEMGLI